VDVDRRRHRDARRDERGRRHPLPRHRCTRTGGRDAHAACR
jgi:hypothetical protein